MRTTLDPFSLTAVGLPILDALNYVHGPAAFIRASELLFAIRPSIESLALIEALLGANSEEWSAAPSSYQHDNGFIKIPLARSIASGASIRLNIWLPVLANMENIHDHRWDYASYVICGHLLEKQFCNSPGGDLYQLFQYVPRGDSNAYALARLGQRKLVEIQTEQINAKRLYVRPHSLLHSITPAVNLLTATLQITFNPIEANYSNVYAMSQLSTGSTRLPSPSITSAVRSSALQHLVASLSEN